MDVSEIVLIMHFIVFCVGFVWCAHYIWVSQDLPLPGREKKDENKRHTDHRL